MIKNGKITFPQEERVLLGESKYWEFIKPYKDSIFLFMEAVNRLPWDHKTKIRNLVEKNIKSYSEDNVYKLINKKLVNLDSIDFEFDVDKISDEVFHAIQIDFPKTKRVLSDENIEKYFNRAVDIIKNSNSKIYFDSNNFYEAFSKIPRFKEKTERFYLQNLLSIVKSNHTIHEYQGFITIKERILLEFKPQILTALSGTDKTIFKFLCSQKENKKFPNDPDIYQAFKQNILQRYPGRLALLDEDISLYFDEILSNHKEIEIDFFNLLPIDFISDNHERIMGKADTLVFGAMIRNKNLQEKNEDFLVKNPDILNKMGVGDIIRFYMGDKEVVRVINPEFLDRIFQTKTNEYINWDGCKNHPDFRERVLIKIREEKRANKIRKRISILTDSNPTEVAARIIYEDYIESRMETLVEETYHKYDTIMEDKIGKIIYDHLEVDGIIENVMGHDITFKRFVGTRQNSIKYHLIREIGNYARGTDFFTKNLKIIEKSIASLREVKKLVEG